jgi:hypothetical protein
VAIWDRALRMFGHGLVGNLAEDREGQISFAPLDSSKETPIQSTILGKVVLAKPKGLAFGLNPVSQP